MGTVYSINEAAAIINRSKDTIKRWQREGLIEPKRDDRGHRYFTEQDIEKLEEIKERKVLIQLSGGQFDEQQSQ